MPSTAPTQSESIGREFADGPIESYLECLDAFRVFVRSLDYYVEDGREQRQQVAYWLPRFQRELKRWELTEA